MNKNTLVYNFCYVFFLNLDVILFLISIGASRKHKVYFILLHSLIHSALDAESERIVQEALDRVVKGIEIYMYFLL